MSRVEHELQRLRIMSSNESYETVVVIFSSESEKPRWVVTTATNKRGVLFLDDDFYIDSGLTPNDVKICRLDDLDIPDAIADFTCEDMMASSRMCMKVEEIFEILGKYIPSACRVEAYKEIGKIILAK